MAIETGAGLLRAEVAGRSVSVGMPDPRDWRMDLSLDTPFGPVPCDFVNTGVPHAVVDLDRCPPSADDPVAQLGPVVRSHPAFGAAGANADFYRAQGSQLTLRTFERGVEAETGACGTGAVATALVAARRGRVAPPVAVRVTNGNVLTVGFRIAADGAAEVTLRGPAEYVFTGEIEW
jgi:diaminopimelate epimerase